MDTQTTKLVCKMMLGLWGSPVNPYQWLFHSFFQKILDTKLHLVIFAVRNQNGALVKGLRRLPFTEESRVRFPYVLLKKPFIF